MNDYMHMTHTQMRSPCFRNLEMGDYFFWSSGCAAWPREGGQEGTVLYRRMPSFFCPLSLEGNDLRAFATRIRKHAFCGRARREEGEAFLRATARNRFAASMGESMSSRRRHRGLRLAADRGKVYSKPVTRIAAVKCTVGVGR